MCGRGYTGATVWCADCLVEHGKTLDTIVIELPKEKNHAVEKVSKNKHTTKRNETLHPRRRLEQNIRKSGNHTQRR